MLCKQFVNGTACARRESGRGTEFFLSIPIFSEIARIILLFCTKVRKGLDFVSPKGYKRRVSCQCNERDMSRMLARFRELPDGARRRGVFRCPPPRAVRPTEALLPSRPDRLPPDIKACERPRYAAMRVVPRKFSFRLSWKSGPGGSFFCGRKTS